MVSSNTTLTAALSPSSSALLPSLQYPKMGFATRESRVLKLVHPGGFVEIHTNPIIASEVMKKNPRHCVTRPDIFKFPWIVVSPDSLLKPGSVFFIVPCHTIHGLLKSRAHGSTSTNHTHNSLRHRGHTHNHRHQYRPDHRERFLRRDSNDSSIQDSELKKNHPSQKQRFMSSLSCITLGKLGHGKKKRTGEHGGGRSIANYSSEYYGTDDGGASVSDWDRGLSQSEQVSKLKSCLKKDNNNCGSVRSRKLKVRFASPDQQVSKTNCKLSTQIYDVHWVPRAE